MDKKAWRNFIHRIREHMTLEVIILFRIYDIVKCNMYFKGYCDFKKKIKSKRILNDLNLLATAVFDLYHFDWGCVRWRSWSVTVALACSLVSYLFRLLLAGKVFRWTCFFWPNSSEIFIIEYYCTRLLWISLFHIVVLPIATKAFVS